MNDRVTEAFYGAMGERLQEDTRRRLFWICEKVKGEFILDVGCSQGICSILLGREGFHVTGIDMDSQAIAFAQAELQKEEQSTQEKVCFLSQNFMDYESSKQADTVILSEILEHLTHPDKILQHALAMLRDHGTMIVTLPFGVNDFPDHKHTYYLQDAYKLLSDCSSIREIVIFGKWIGFRCEKSEEPSIPIDDELIDRVETAIENTERSNQQQLAALRKSVEQYKKNYETVRANEQALDKKMKAVEKQLVQKEEEIAEIAENNRKELSELTSKKNAEIAELTAMHADALSDQDHMLAEAAAMHEQALAELAAMKDAEIADLKASYENALAIKDSMLRESNEYEAALLQMLAQCKLTMEALQRSLRDIQMDVSENEQKLLTEITALKKRLAESAEKENSLLRESTALRQETKDALPGANAHRMMERSRVGKAMMKIFFCYHKFRECIAVKIHRNTGKKKKSA